MKRRRRFDAKITYFCSSLRGREKDALDNPRHIRMRWRTLCSPPPGLCVGQGGRLDRSLSGCVCLLSSLCLLEKEKIKKKKKAFFH